MPARSFTRPPRRCAIFLLPLAAAAGVSPLPLPTLAAEVAAPANPETTRARGDSGPGPATLHGGLTPIHTIQGSGPRSPLAGRRVTTSGVVTWLVNNGFFLQDPEGDGDDATSDGIFAYTRSAPTVAVGQRVQLTATVTEFDVSLGAANPAAQASPLTELTDIGSLSVIGRGTIAPTRVTPLTADGLERHEGMLVTLSGPLTVQQNFFQGRYGQITLAASGRREVPTNRHRPNSDAARALAGENARATLLLDDGSSRQNPSPTPYLGAGGAVRVGDTVEALTGVLDFGLASHSSAGPVAYRLHPSAAPMFTAANPRPARPPEVGGNVKLAAFNVLNYFTTFTDGRDAGGQSGQGCTLGNGTPSASLCRGANNQAEFERQRAKIIEVLAAIDADAVGLTEIQNNGSGAAQNLVDGLNARLGAGTYAVVPAPAGGGTGSDAIRVALIYKPARLLLAGPALSDPAPVHRRPPLAQTFSAANGEKFSVVVSHFKSKGCGNASGADLDQGDGQGCYNATRLAQARALRSFVTRVQSASGSQDLLITGDLNAYAQEDPIHELTSAGHVDQIGRFNAFGYSYVFDGTSGRLDHAITSASLSPKVVSARSWAINADESALRDYNQEFKAPRVCSGQPCPADPYAADAYRASDHDPVLIGLNLVRAIPGTAAPEAPAGASDEDRAGAGGRRRAQAAR